MVKLLEKFSFTELLTQLRMVGRRKVLQLATSYYGNYTLIYSKPWAMILSVEEQKERETTDDIMNQWSTD